MLTIPFPTEGRQKPDVSGCWWGFSSSVKRLWNVCLCVNTVEVLTAYKQKNISLQKLSSCYFGWSNQHMSMSSQFSFSKLTQNNLNFSMEFFSWLLPLAWVDLMKVTDGGNAELHNDTDEESVFNVDQSALQAQGRPRCPSGGSNWCIPTFAGTKIEPI